MNEETSEHKQLSDLHVQQTDGPTLEQDGTPSSRRKSKYTVSMVVKSMTLMLRGKDQNRKRKRKTSSSGSSSWSWWPKAFRYKINRTETNIPRVLKDPEFRWSHSRPPLAWPLRKRIALDAATGLVYLHEHCVPTILYVKAANILLDEDFEAVVGDFGLVRPMDNKDTHVTTAVRGTIGHIAPEYLATGKSSKKTDVFGYRIMLLELITGQRAFDLARRVNDDEAMLLDWVKHIIKERKIEMMVDADLRGNHLHDELEQLLQLAILCTQDSPMKRPKMSEVVRMLLGEGLVERWFNWTKEEIWEPLPCWVVADSTCKIPPEELSGPR